MKSRKFLVPLMGYALLFLLLSLESCKPKTFHEKLKNQFFDPRYAKYVSAFSNGSISRKGTIKVRFTKDMASVEETGKEAKSSLFSFSPGIEGKYKWVDSRTIEFKPNALLPSGEVFQCELNIGKLYDDVPSDLKTFGFQVYTLPQEIEVQLAYVQPQSERSLDMMKFDAEIKTGQFEEGKELEKIFEAKANGKTLKLKWTHSENGMSHHLYIDSLKRLSKSSYIEFEYNGSDIGAGEKEKFKVEVPAKGNFKMVANKAFTNPEQYIFIAFSDPLMPNQDLTGLIHLDSNIQFKFSIDGSIVRAYPLTQVKSNEQVKIYLEPGIKNIAGETFAFRDNFDTRFMQVFPTVRLFGNGGIIPTSDNVPLSFETINLKAVDVQVKKIYDNGVLNFFDNNDVASEHSYYGNMERLGKVVFEKKIRLDEDPTVDLNQFSEHTLDLAKIIKTDPGAIYHVTIRFRRSYSLYDCGEKSEKPRENNYLTEGSEKLWDYYNKYDYLNDGEYGNDPCHFNYFQGNETGAACNVLSSNLGILAKRDGEGNLFFALSDLKTTNPIKDVKINVYNTEKQIINTLTTDGDGFARMHTTEEIFLAAAEKDGQKGYLKFSGNATNLSKFDISGENYTHGVKGMIYADRGVWRPGDSIYLCFILEDKKRALPIDHPITFEMTNPRGQVVQKMIRTSSLNGLYTFHTATELTAPTGTYHVTINAGGLKFDKNLKVETIMPNRIKLDLQFAKTYLTPQDKTVGEFNARWLMGAPAKGLVTEISVNMTKSAQPFPQYKDFLFYDSTQRFIPETRLVFKDALNDDGHAIIPFNNFPGTYIGPMNLFFTGKVFEQGGAFSTNVFNSMFMPFNSFVGLRLPKSDQDENAGYGYYERGSVERLKTGQDNNIELVNVNKDGRPSDDQLTIFLYRTQYRYWYEYNQDNNAYNGRNSSELVSKSSLSTSGGKAVFKLNIKQKDAGVYFIRVCNKDGHYSGRVFSAEQEYSNAETNTKAGTILADISTSKPAYKVGEDAVIHIPSPYNGKALVSIETGSRILKTEWIKTASPSTDYRFKVTADMSPNVYAYVNIIQPHAQTKNDLPIRMYGVIPVSVEDPASHLLPVISLPKVLQPEASTMLKVSEKDGKPMTYTIAIVDEGLLDLTRFKTPDPWPNFYKNESYTNTTWDVFDMVLGSSNIKTGKMLTLGGDEGKIAPDAGSKVQRFKPMVRFLGPFNLRAHSTATHKIDMPQYVGSVRAMIIAEDEGAYGRAELTTPVRKPLMVLGTLPRVLGPGEEVMLPVNVFAMEDFVKNVSVQVRINDMFISQGNLSQSVNFNRKGEQMLNFPLKVKDQVGVATVQIIARSGNETAHYNMEIEVRPPNPPIAKTSETAINDNKEHIFPYTAFGMKGTNRASLEISSIPSLNLEERLDYLIQYPHGCIEQTTSAVFPQLFVMDLANLNPEQRKDMERNIKIGLNRLLLFQVADGGFSYWPGMANEGADDWGTNYAGHFMIEAQKHGFSLPTGMLDSWKSYQKRRANGWTPISRHYFGVDNTDMMQSYRLYLLALVKSPELGAMNRMREKPNLEPTARWHLAAAYYLCGQPSIGEELVKNQSVDIPAYRESGFTYGSDVRDKAIILEALSVMHRQDRTLRLVQNLSGIMKSDSWLSTQETAYPLMALAKAGLSSKTGGLDLEYSVNGEPFKQLKTNNSIFNIKLSPEKIASGTVKVRNKKGGYLFTSMLVRGIPAAGNIAAEQSKLQMEVTYRNMSGISMSVDEIEQGRDFVAEVQVKNPGTLEKIDAMALSLIFPSGWQIYNSRMERQDMGVKSSIPDYADIRDDREYIYFSLMPANTVQPRQITNPYTRIQLADEEKPSSEKIFRVVLNASYLGTFYLPSVYAEAMYDRSFHATTAGRWVKVVKGKAGI
jgi:uncharacterized protein YfaS (alpha-2-macroglobulin family)